MPSVVSGPVAYMGLLSPAPFHLPLSDDPASLHKPVYKNSVYDSHKSFFFSHLYAIQLKLNFNTSIGEAA